ncbi:YaaA family protein [Sphingomonas sp. LaA6.9]|uniref:YaaA family protein n=1 Tax=Sphingomonas sp. LaA6.9 TaxID=2919914 RepID=UPI001F4F8D65|nr:YaaA family protein [Sphingomonas sp. LaA6.9]MCJ8156213.1 YaaA family protein [Sphingomonas sp. LaA6.9]
MLAFLSPAKTLDYKSAIPPFAETLPRFETESMILAGAASELSAARLQAIMDISENLAVLNAERYANFENLPTRPALFAFAGDVYTGFEAKSLPAEAITFAQDRIRILSGLYGLLRPLDGIRPYRLEMGTRWAPATGDLYGFWGNRIADLAVADLATEGHDTIINLASQEYWGAVKNRLPEHVRVITVDFREIGPNGDLRFNSFAAKRARGMMARYLCEHRLTDPEALKGFDSDGYAFDPEGTEGDVWRFIRR